MENVTGNYTWNHPYSSRDNIGWTITSGVAASRNSRRVTRH